MRFAAVSMFWHVSEREMGFDLLRIRIRDPFYIAIAIFRSPVEPGFAFAVQWRSLPWRVLVSRSVVRLCDWQKEGSAIAADQFISILVSMAVSTSPPRGNQG